MVWCLRVVVVNLEILLKTLATMVRKEKQWEVEDKNLRTMGTENSRQIQIRISGHHFLRGGGVLLHQLLFVCRTRVPLNSSVVGILCSLNLGWNFLSSGFVLYLFHLQFLGCRNLRLRDWGFEVTVRGFCCFAEKLPSEVTSPFLPFIFCSLTFVLTFFIVWICSTFVTSSHFEVSSGTA